MKYSQNLLIIL